MSLLRPTVLLCLLNAAACGPRSVVVSSIPSASGSRPQAATAPGSAPRNTDLWRIETREHVDLWLHGFALLQADSSLVPYFRLDYRDELSRVRRSAGVTTGLDQNYLVLTRRIAGNPGLTSAQFLAMYFASWEELRRGCQRFLRDGGDMRLAANRETVRMYATLATYFPTAADRDWLRLFMESLEDERTRFHRGWWQQQSAARATTRSELTLLWNTGYGAAFQRFLRHSGQRTGSLLLTLPLGGEGRSIDVGNGDNFMAVTWPPVGHDAREVLYATAHEVVGTTTNQVVRDNTTPADQQSGETGRLSTLAAVRGGAILLERIAPELAEGYRRYYLVAARQIPGADLTTQFTRVFAIPDRLHTALVRQVDLVLNGI